MFILKAWACYSYINILISLYSSLILNGQVHPSGLLASSSSLWLFYIPVIDSVPVFPHQFYQELTFSLWLASTVVFLNYHTASSSLETANLYRMSVRPILLIVWRNALKWMVEVLFFWGGVSHPACSGVLLALRSGITPGGLRKPYGMPGSNPGRLHAKQTLFPLYCCS